MELNEFFKGGYTRFSHAMNKSYYWRYVLSTEDKIVLPTLLESIIIDKTFYNNGLLIANIKHESLLDKIGSMSYSKLRRSLDHLDSTGAIVRLHKKFRNSRYFLGFRHKNGNDRIYLLYYLLMQFEEIVEDHVNNLAAKIELNAQKSDKLKDVWKIPKISNNGAYCIKEDYKTFIVDNIRNVNEIKHKRLLDNKTLFELLFNCRYMYEKPLLKQTYAAHNDLLHGSL